MKKNLQVFFQGNNVVELDQTFCSCSLYWFGSYQKLNTIDDLKVQTYQGSTGAYLACQL